MPETLFDEAPVININGKQYVSVDEIERRLEQEEKKADKQQESPWPNYMKPNTVADYLNVSAKMLKDKHFFELLDGFKLGERTTIYSKKSVDRALRKYQLLGGE